MTDMFAFRGLCCFPSARDAAIWHFVPQQPDVQRGDDGRPLVVLMEAGADAYLIFTATWRASSKPRRIAP